MGRRAPAECLLPAGRRSTWRGAESLLEGLLAAARCGAAGLVPDPVCASQSAGPGGAAPALSRAAQTEVEGGMKQRITPHRGRWAAASLPFIVLGCLAVWLALQSMASLQALGNRLAPDGSLEILGLIPEQTIRLAMALAAMILLGLGGVMLLRPGWLIERVHVTIRLIRRIPGDFKAFWVDLRGWPHLRRDGWILLAIMAASLLIRAPLLDRPMFHDESYTAVTWAPGPLTYILEDYHLPNNHIFHTILVSWTHDLFGSQPWSMRLPAFIAALLLIPAGYGLTRRWYGRVPAIIAAALIGIAPIITDYATNARGYSLFMLFSLLIFWLAARLVRRNNLIEWLPTSACTRRWASA